jgi:hypothetical protein
MANNLTASSPALWSKIPHKNLIKKSIFRSIASFAEQGGLSMGLSVDRPSRTLITTGKYIKGVALTAQDITTTSDKLTINDSSSCLVFYDKVDKKQNSIDNAMEATMEMGRQMAKDVDASVLYTGAVGATSVVDASTFGGTSGVGLTMTTSNVKNILSKAKLKLHRLNVDIEQGNLFAAISGEMHDVLLQTVSDREDALGAKKLEDGIVGNIMGFDLLLTNNCPASVRVTLTDNPSNGETLTVNGVVFTFVTSIGTAAGNVLIGSATADTIDNLVELINAPETTTARGVALTGENLKVVQRWVATDGTTYLDVWAKGASYMTASATNDITFSRYTQHVVAGVKGSIDCVIQIDTNIERSPMIAVGKFGENIGGIEIFGTKVFNKGTNELVDIKIDTSAF